MSPEKGPRRHFTHQQMSPNFVQQNYEDGPGGKVEKKVEAFFKKLKVFFLRSKF
jgi:hypothetical protein